MSHPCVVSALFWKQVQEDAIVNRDNAIVDAVASGVPITRIAKELSMSRVGIYDILSRKRPVDKVDKGV